MYSSVFRNVDGLSSFSGSFFFWSSLAWPCRLTGHGNENFRRGAGVIFFIAPSWQCRHFVREMRNGATIRSGAWKQRHGRRRRLCVGSAAMVFKFYGIDVDPQQLNWFLTSAGGYTENGWLYWDRAAWFAPDRVRHVYEDLASYQLIDSNLSRGNPVIVRVRLPGGVTHFVVIAGKEGSTISLPIPAPAPRKASTRCARRLGSDIEALRFYESITTTHSQASAQR